MVDKEQNLEKLFEKFIDERRFTKKLRSETLRGYEAVFRLFLKIMPAISETGDLNSDVLNQFFKIIDTRTRPRGKEYVTGVKPSTAKTHWSKLNVFFSWLELNNYIIENPLREIDAPKVSYKDPKSLKDNEIQKIYTSIVVDSHNSLLLRRDTCMVSLLSYLGLRKGEFISLKVFDIDMEKKLITVRGETSKSKEDRILPMHSTLCMHLKDYLQERKRCGLKTENLIVSSRGDRGLSRDGLNHWVKALRKKSGVRFHLHQFRHTYACKLGENDIGVFKLQKLLGHTDIQMTMKYVRSMRPQDMGSDVAKISYV